MTHSNDRKTAAAKAPALILDADQGSTLCIVRALGRAGVEVEVAGSTDDQLAMASRYAARSHRYPDPLTDEQAFVGWIRSRLAERRYAMVVPVTERTIAPLLRARASLDDGALAMAPSGALEQVLDKDRTVALARDLDIPVPASVLITTIQQLERLPDGIDFPVVVKPARSVGTSGSRNVQLSVSYAFDRRQLEAQVREALRYGQVIVQEYFRGAGVGIELIADHGRVCHAFQHRRLHEVPLTGGGSSLRVSEAVVPELRAAAEALIAALGWHGVAMVEFKYAADTGAFRLMEINGRFWGSLPLAVAAGANFPLMLHELMTIGSVTEHPPARPGVYCRHLARDLDWLEQVLRRNAPAQLVTLPAAGQILRDWMLVFSPRHHFDVQSWRDLRPGLTDIARIGRGHWARVCSMLARRRQMRRALAAARPGGEAGRRLASARELLFVCYGNINRSALAHAYAAQRPSNGLTFVSAGFHRPDGRPADPTMVEIAAGRGIDLSGNRSRALDPQMVASADLIFVMELAQIERLEAEFPAARGKTFLLGAVDAAGGAEIPDPYGKAPEVYAKVCSRIVTAVDRWLGLRGEST